ENVTGNSKAAKRTRSSVESAVKTAQQKLGAPQKSSSKSGKLLLVGTIVAAIIAVVVASTKKSAAH
ncbi:MAG TPA: hypothetical protein DCY59_09995, partial [Micrococcaceae bacterium]|nr:hypothetical protein [Micrococcaceae bacterium]